nr:phage portal protein [Sporohalobacter salinus]
MNTWHYRACKAKARDTAGDYKLTPLVDDSSEDQKQLLEDVIGDIDPEGNKSITEILEKFQLDYESTGNNALEIIGEGDNLKFKHIPAHTVRRTKDRQVYVQKRGTKKRYFKRFGVNFDLHYKSGEEYPEGQLSDEKDANEILHLMNYSSRSDYYGTPDNLPALMSILGDRESQEYNLEFFENHAVPDYAVTVTGTSLDKNTKKRIKKYFNESLKENRRTTLVITADKDDTDSEIDIGSDQEVEIKFEKLAADVKNSSFRLYRQDNRDEILAAHGVPPYRAAVAISGSLGQNVAEETNEIYKNSTIDPRQTILEQRINMIFQQKLEITDWRFEFVELDTSDQEKEDERHFKGFDKGAITPNELRQHLGYETKDDKEALNSHYVNGKAITGPLAQLSANDPVRKAKESEVVKAVHKMKEKLANVVKKHE